MERSRALLREARDLSESEGIRFNYEDCMTALEESRCMLEQLKQKLPETTMSTGEADKQMNDA